MGKLSRLSSRSKSSPNFCRLFQCRGILVDIFKIYLFLFNNKKLKHFKQKNYLLQTLCPLLVCVLYGVRLRKRFISYTFLCKWAFLRGEGKAICFPTKPTNSFRSPLNGEEEFKYFVAIGNRKNTRWQEIVFIQGFMR